MKGGLKKQLYPEQNINQDTAQNTDVHVRQSFKNISQHNSLHLYLTKYKNLQLI